MKALHQMYKEDAPFRIYGAHTNLYITENDYNGMFVDISSKNAYIKFCEQTKEFTMTSNILVSDLVHYATSMGYDFSILAGIPGMVGGGIVGNSSYPSVTGKEYREFGYFVKKMIVYDFELGEIKEIIPDNNFFSTRSCFKIRFYWSRRCNFIK